MHAATLNRQLLVKFTSKQVLAAAMQNKRDSCSDLLVTNRTICSRVLLESKNACKQHKLVDDDVTHLHTTAATQNRYDSCSDLVVMDRAICGRVLHQDS